MKNEKENKKDSIKELVKPQAADESLRNEAEFLCGEHLASCRRNNSIVDDDDILF